MLLPCLAGREATGSQNLQKMRMLLGSRRGHLKLHKTYACLSAEVSGKVLLIQACPQIRGVALDGHVQLQLGDMLGNKHLNGMCEVGLLLSRAITAKAASYKNKRGTSLEPAAVVNIC